MALNSSDVSAGDDILYSDHNTLRDDIQEIVAPKYIIGDIAAKGILDAELLSKSIHPQNLILNGNFEVWNAGIDGAGVDGTAANCPEGWVANESPTNILKVAGVKTDPLGVNSDIVKVTADGIYDGIKIQQNTWLKVKPSTIYTLSFWNKVDAVDDIIEIHLQDYEGANAGTVHLNDVNISSATSWGLYTKTFTTASDADNLDLVLYLKASGDIMYLSGMSLCEGSAPFAFIESPRDYRTGLKHTRYISLSPSDFKSFGQVLSYPVGAAYGVFAVGAGAEAGLSDGIHLPNGAVMTSINYYVYGQGGGTGVISCRLMKADRTGTSTQIGTTKSSANAASYQTLTDDFADETIVNTHSYYIILDTTINLVRICGAEIVFTVTNPLP